MTNATLTSHKEKLAKASLYFQQLTPTEIHALRWYAPHRHIYNTSKPTPGFPKQPFERAKGCFDGIQIWDDDRSVHSRQFIIGFVNDSQAGKRFYLAAMVDAMPLERIVHGYRLASQDRSRHRIGRPLFLISLFVACGLPAMLLLKLYNGHDYSVVEISLAGLTTVVAGLTALRTVDTMYALPSRPEYVAHR